jgi:uncharacterized membrane protein YcjF (UPF0283 family)
MRRIPTSTIPLFLALAALALTNILGFPQIWQWNQWVAGIDVVVAIIILSLSLLIVLRLLLRIIAEHYGSQYRNEGSGQASCKANKKGSMFIKQHLGEIQKKDERGYSEDDC